MILTDNLIYAGAIVLGLGGAGLFLALGVWVGLSSIGGQVGGRIGSSANKFSENVNVLGERVLREVLTALTRIETKVDRLREMEGRK